MCCPCRCLDDVDDEVRDRAALYLKLYEDHPLADMYVKEGERGQVIMLSPSPYQCSSHRIHLFIVDIGVEARDVHQRSRCF